MVSLLTIQLVKEFPGRVGQIEERLSLLVYQETAVLGEADARWQFGGLKPKHGKQAQDG